MKKTQVKPVAIVMGSKSDLPVMREAEQALKEFGIASSMAILSAHRTPHQVASFAESARRLGVKVIIAGAGGAAHLPGMVAAYTELPVIGVPVPIGNLKGQDALLSIVQMPKGIPVATVAIGNAWNAGVLAAQMLGAGEGGKGQAFEKVLDRVLKYKGKMRKTVLKNRRLR
ncbi:MAG: 5-(carboxyamino)imidazole ribonucleotide mutase [Bacteriovoracia bacterium]